MDYFYYFEGTMLEGFSARSDKAALQFIRQRYLEATGVVIPVSASTEEHKSAIAKSETVDKLVLM